MQQKQSIDFSPPYQNIQEVFCDLEELVGLCGSKLESQQDKLIASAVALSMQILSDSRSAKKELDVFFAKLDSQLTNTPDKRSQLKEWIPAAEALSSILTSAVLLRDQTIYEAILKKIENYNLRSNCLLQELMPSQTTISQILLQRDFDRLNMLIDLNLSPVAIADQLYKWCEYNCVDSDLNKRSIGNALIKLAKKLNLFRNFYFRSDRDSCLELRDNLLFHSCVLLNEDKIGSKVVTLMNKTGSPAFKGKLFGLLLARVELEGETESAYHEQILEVAEEYKSSEDREIFVSNFIITALKFNKKIVDRIHRFFDNKLANLDEAYSLPALWIAISQRANGDLDAYSARFKAFVRDYRDIITGTLREENYFANKVDLYFTADLQKDVIIAEAIIAGDSQRLANCIESHEKEARKSASKLSWTLTAIESSIALNSLGLEQRALESARELHEDPKWIDLLYTNAINRKINVLDCHYSADLLPDVSRYKDEIGSSDIRRSAEVKKMIRAALVPLLYNQFDDAREVQRSLIDHINSSIPRDNQEANLIVIKHVFETYLALRRSGVIISSLD